DRNGVVLAMDVRSASLYAEPRSIVDVDEAMEAIAAVFPDAATADLRRRLTSGSAFAWIRREITPQQEAAIRASGIPGLGFLYESQRVYPSGREVAHVVGQVDVDNQGIAG